MTNESRLGGAAAQPGSPRAVFLSYASEDAAAAQRICAALRAAGIEVWFDQSELRGGDAWDSAIRRQIKSCALFVPIISATTHARIEGYFRLEWKLALDRSHLLAPDHPFIVPVAIDPTPQSDERLPERFRELQWTRLPQGETPPAFTERIARLLSVGAGEPGAPDARPRLSSSPRPAAPSDSAATAAKTKPTRSRAVLLAAAVILAGLITFGLYRWAASPHGRPDPAAAAAGRGIGALPAAALEKSIAVLPFVDESEKKDQEYFSDGLSDELIDLLAKTPGLRVPARTSSFYFKGKQATLAEIGKALNVSHVLEGSVRKSGSALRISAELVNVADDARVWSETYDRTLDDVFKVQDDIATSVVAALKVSMLGEAKPRPAPTSSSEAYLHFLRAQEAASEGTRDSLPTAFAEYQRAVTIDPAFAEAWTGLATLTMNGFVGSGTGTYEKVRADVLSELQRSLQLNPELAVTYAELGRLYYQLDWNGATAQVEINRALELDPQNRPALWVKGYIDDCEGRFEDAIAIHEKLRGSDPLGVDNYRQLGNAYYRAGRLEEGAAILTEALRRFPTLPTGHYRLGLILLAQNKPEAALKEFSLETDPDFRRLGSPLALDRLGRRTEADQLLAQALAEEEARNGAAYQIALVYAARGDRDSAFQWLERGFRQRDAGMLWMRYDPLLKPLAADPRFSSIVSRMSRLSHPAAGTAPAHVG